MPELGTLAAVAVAAFVAGALNAVVGGGSFLTLPALVWAGLPPVVANATGTAALLPGYLAGAWGFGAELRAPATGAALPLRWPALAALCALGGAAGAALLLALGNAVFAALVRSPADLRQPEVAAGARSGWGVPMVWEDASTLTAIATWLFYVGVIHLHLGGLCTRRTRAALGVLGVVVIVVINGGPDLGPWRNPFAGGWHA